MTDIHSHILYDIDDGSSSVEESIELLKKMYNIGFNNVILTPHYIFESKYNKNNYEKLENFKLLKNKIKEEKIDINIFLGNEVYISDNVIDLIKNNEIFTLNNTKYILIELPFNNKLLNLMSIIDNIKASGYIPVIAHPERYIYFQNNYLLVDELKNEDVLFQCNYQSIIGFYGKDAKKLFKYLLKNKYVDYLGTDIHKNNNILKKFNKIKKKIIKITGEKYYNFIEENSDNLVNN